MNVNLKLKSKIIEKFGTQVDFAQSLGVDETFVSKIVRGRRKLLEEEKIRWAKTLDCRIADIFPDEK